MLASHVARAQHPSKMLVRRVSLSHAYADVFHYVGRPETQHTECESVLLQGALHRQPKFSNR
eukprot:3099024-Pleurochrysis_carterae.AAC.1